MVCVEVGGCRVGDAAGQGADDEGDAACRRPGGRGGGRGGVEEGEDGGDCEEEVGGRR